MWSLDMLLAIYWDNKNLLFDDYNDDITRQINPSSTILHWYGLNIREIDNIIKKYRGI